MAVRCLAFLFVASASATRSACPSVVDHALDLETSDSASVSLLQAGAAFTQHSIVTAEVDENAEVVEGEPLDEEDIYPSAGTEEVSLLSVAPLAVEVSATAVAPGAPISKTPNAAALALARMVREDREAEVNVRTSLVSQRGHVESAGETVWRYQPYNKLMADIRAVPSVSGERTNFEIHPGAMFRVLEEVVGDDAITYLKLADGRGWLFDRLANGGVMCTREETPKDIGTVLLETVSKFRLGFQATGATGATARARRTSVHPRGHRGNNLSNLLIPLALILCTIIFFLIISRFARPAPVESHVRPYMRHRGIVQDTYTPQKGVARPRSPLQSPQRRQSFNLVTGMYEAPSPPLSLVQAQAAPPVVVTRELPPMQAQVIQQQHTVARTLSAMPLGDAGSYGVSRGRSPTRVRQAVTLEAGVDLYSSRQPRPAAYASTRPSSLPPGSERAGRAELCYVDQWSPASAQPFRSMKLSPGGQQPFHSMPVVPAVPVSMPAMGSAQATLLGGR